MDSTVETCFDAAAMYCKICFEASVFPDPDSPVIHQVKQARFYKSRFLAVHHPLRNIQTSHYLFLTCINW